MKKIYLMSVILSVLFLSTNTFGQQNSFRTLNLMDDFWKFWAQAEKADPPTRVKLYRELVIAPHKEIFAGFTGAPDDEDLISYFKALAPLIPRMQKITANLSTELPRQTARFKKTFPDLNWPGTVVFFVNYGTTDSGTGMIDGQKYLIFGVDTIAAIYGEKADLSVLFSHELFHLYHSQFVNEFPGKLRDKGEVPLYSMVWAEGLAVYVSHRLNPNAASEQTLMSRTLENEAAPQLAKLAGKFRENFDAKAPEIWRLFMAGDNNNKEIPDRSGYYLGYRIAEELGKKMSLRQLVRLSGAELQKKMKRVLAKLEK